MFGRFSTKSRKDIDGILILTVTLYGTRFDSTDFGVNKGLKYDELRVLRIKTRRVTYAPGNSRYTFAAVEGEWDAFLCVQSERWWVLGEQSIPLWVNMETNTDVWW
jgi:hypothetical protein